MAEHPDVLVSIFEHYGSCVFHAGTACRIRGSDFGASNGVGLKGGSEADLGTDTEFLNCRIRCLSPDLG